MKISVPARYESLPLIIAELVRYTEEQNIPEAVEQRLQLIIEEIFLNTIEHGYGGNSEDHIELALQRNEYGITLLYEDSAPPFDTSQAEAQTLLETNVGGFGISLIQHFSKSVRYRRDTSKNITEMDIDWES